MFVKRKINPGLEKQDSKANYDIIFDVFAYALFMF